MGKGVALTVWNEGKNIKLQNPLTRLAYVATDSINSATRALSLGKIIRFCSNSFMTYFLHV